MHLLKECIHVELVCKARRPSSQLHQSGDNDLGVLYSNGGERGTGNDFRVLYSNGGEQDKLQSDE